MELHSKNPNICSAANPSRQQEEENKSQAGVHTPSVELQSLFPPGTCSLVRGRGPLTHARLHPETDVEHVGWASSTWIQLLLLQELE